MIIVPFAFIVYVTSQKLMYTMNTTCNIKVCTCSYCSSVSIGYAYYVIECSVHIVCRISVIIAINTLCTYIYLY